ncbi:MAG: DNA cytosine methyltransferase [Halothece sp.]
MGFPDSFIFPVSRTQMYRQLGNSVAVPVIRAIAQQVYSALEQMVRFTKN